MPAEQPQGLIHELRIKNGDVAGRDDAAMDLAGSDPEAGLLNAGVSVRPREPCK